MIIDWTYELWIATSLLGIVFIISSFWAKDLIKILFLFVGFSGLWLAIAEPKFNKAYERENFEVDDVASFLYSDKAQITDTVILRGNDYDIEELTLLSDYLIKHKDNDVESGFIEIIIPNEIRAGEEFDLNGRFLKNDVDVKQIWLEKQSNAKRLASVKEDGSFSISERALVKGLYEFMLKGELVSGDTISEIIPIEVLAPAKLKMLILASSPQFDLNYLKNYWVEQEHAVVQKVKISKDKYSQAFINTSQIQFTTLTNNVLRGFDILYLDMKTWNQLSPSERSRIRYNVQNNGLGLVLRPNNPGDVGSDLPYHTAQQFGVEDIMGVSLTKTTFNTNRSWRKIEDGYLLKEGLGAIFLLETSDSYKLILADQVETYQEIWARIFSALFVRFGDGIKIRVPFLTFENTLIPAELSYINQEETYMHNDSIKLNINFTPLLDGYGEADVESLPGWNKISGEASKEKAWYYAHILGSWKAMKDFRVKNYIEHLQRNKAGSISRTYERAQSIPWWISIVLFVLGFGLVWLMEKIK